MVFHVLILPGLWTIVCEAIKEISHPKTVDRGIGRRWGIKAVSRRVTTGGWIRNRNRTVGVRRGDKPLISNENKLRDRSNNEGSRRWRREKNVVIESWCSKRRLTKEIESSR